MESNGMAGGRAARMSGIAWRTLLLAALWWLITQGRTDAWLVGLPVVVLAALASVALGNDRHSGFSPAALPGFLMLFLRDSVRSAEWASPVCSSATRLRVYCVKRTRPY